jgi:hypothetical protein
MGIFILIAALEACTFYLWGRYHGFLLGKAYSKAYREELQSLFCDFIHKNSLDEKWLRFLFNGDKTARRSTATSTTAK